jgi:hypothetical protein
MLGLKPWKSKRKSWNWKFQASPYQRLDPNFAALYRRKVERWPANLDTTDSRTEAAGIPRSLVETIRVRNLYIGIEIEFVGKITNIIKAAQTANQRGKPAS